MSRRVRVEFNLRGFRELRTSPAMDALVLEAAERTAQAAGEGFVAKRSPGRNRARAVVVPDTPEAARVSAETPAVLIGAMRA